MYNIRNHNDKEICNRSSVIRLHKTTGNDNVFTLSLRVRSCGGRLLPSSVISPVSSLNFADVYIVNHLMSILNRRATNHHIAIQWLVHWPLMGGLLHLVPWWGAWAAGAPPSPLLAVPNVTAHPSTASVPTSCYLMWHYSCLWTLKG